MEVKQTENHICLDEYKMGLEKTNKSDNKNFNYIQRNGKWTEEEVIIFSKF
jgi:hypothetical protein